jgi:hypothetical protein
MRISAFRLPSAAFLVILLAFPIEVGLAVAQCPGGQCPAPWTQGKAGIRKTDTLDRREPTGHELAVVRVVNHAAGGQSYIGSGVVVDYRGRQVILSAWHTFRPGPQRIEVTSHAGKRLDATMAARDQTWDLAILLSKEALPDYAALRYGSVAEVGERVVSCGFGPGSGRDAKEGRLGEFAANAGAVLRYGTIRGGDASDLIVVSGSARQGDSGGPIFDGRGRVAGILSATDGSEVVGTQVGRIGKLLASMASEAGPATIAREKIEAPPVVPPAAAATEPPKTFGQTVQGAGLQGFGIFGNRERGATDAAELKKIFSTYTADVTALRQNIQKMDANIQTELTGVRATVGDVSTKVRAEVAGLRTDIGDVKNEVGVLRTQIAASLQAGLINSNLQNEGTQVFAGDTNLLSALVVCAVLVMFLVVILVAIVVRGRTKIALQKHAAVVLAASMGDQDAREKSLAAPPNVRAAVAEAIQTKNAGA